MKAIIEFNLDCEEDKESYQLFNQRPNYKHAIFEIDCWLRNKIKYNDDSSSSDEIKAYEKVRSELWETLSENNIHELN